MEKYNVDCLVLGGGVAGLSISSYLSKKFKEIYLIEKNNLIGEESSSRNSEVIHAGIYYKKDSLKSNLCIRGKQLLYEYLDQKKINYLKCGKFLVSSNDQESEELEKLRLNAKDCGVEDLSYHTDLNKKYPFLSCKEALFSPSSGIFDSHTFLNSLRNDLENSGGTVLLGNRCKKVEVGSNGFHVLVEDINNDQEFFIETKVLINSSGLYAAEIANNIFQERKFKPIFLKGDYYTYTGKEKLNHLIYPLPKQKSLGIHATLDLGKGIRFGPSAYEVNEIDYQVSIKHKESFHTSITKYWPSIRKQELKPGYSGIRAMVDGEDDFLIDIQNFNQSILVNVLGYASPGLTSSLALAEHVIDSLNKY